MPSINKIEFEKILKQVLEERANLILSLKEERLAQKLREGQVVI
jgi:hypothetical protein